MKEIEKEIVKKIETLRNTYTDGQGIRKKMYAMKLINLPLLLIRVTSKDKKDSVSSMKEKYQIHKEQGN